MPRKTKEQSNLEEEKVTKSNSKSSKSTPKSKTTATAKTTKSKTVASSKKSTSKTASSKKTSATKKSTATTKASKTSDEKKSQSTTTKTRKTSDEKKSQSTTKARKSASAKKTTTAKTTTRKTTRKSAVKKEEIEKEEKVEIVEYYDLPYRYNQTVVKVLAQTPTNLFIYWDISDDDRKNFEKQYGENFFENTKPILIIHNDTLNYSFEVEINDFANSWYLHVNDAKCDYRVELGRRPIMKNEKLNTNYIYISMSNKIESPNDHILFNINPQKVIFRNIKTGKQSEKYFSTLSFFRGMENLYNIHDLYKFIYQKENIEEFYNLSNPSSGNPTSGNPSSGSIIKY